LPKNKDAMISGNTMKKLKR